MRKETIRYSNTPISPNRRDARETGLLGLSILWIWLAILPSRIVIAFSEFFFFFRARIPLHNPTKNPMYNPMAILKFPRWTACLPFFFILISYQTSSSNKLLIKTLVRVTLVQFLYSFIHPSCLPGVPHGRHNPTEILDRRAQNSTILPQSW